MPKTVDIRVNLVAKTKIDDRAMREWLTDLGVGGARVDEIVSDEKTDAERVTEAAGRRCYMSFEPGLNPNVTRIRKDIGDYIENILKAGHGSVLEHCSYTFAIEGVSRVFTGEMNRHRAGTAISEGSMRFIRFDDISYWLPTSIDTGKKEDLAMSKLDVLTALVIAISTEIDRTKVVIPADIRNAMSKLCDAAHDIGAWIEGGARNSTEELDDKKRQSQAIFDVAFNITENLYSYLQLAWTKELAPDSKFGAKKAITSMMRRIVPMGVATGGFWTGNVRALRHICEMRTTEHAEEEILLVATKILNILKKEDPHLFGDFTQDEHGYFKPLYRKV